MAELILWLLQILTFIEEGYLPAASRYHVRASEGSAVGASLVRWRRDITCHWNTVRFGTVDIQTHDGRHFLRVQVIPGDFAPEQLRVELYADPVQGGAPDLEVMIASRVTDNSTATQTYSADIPATRPASDYTARMRPYHRSASMPLEASEILWQR